MDRGRPMSNQDAGTRAAHSARRNHLWRLSSATVGMFAFGFALVPMYDALCELTGFNGRSSDMSLAASVTEQVDESRTVTVEFVTTVNGGAPWKFAAETQKLTVHPGKLYTVNFTAHNPRGEAVVAQAVPSVAPWNAAKYLKKTECFCFRQQPFAAGEEKVMPVRFMLEPGLPAEVDTVTLSYTFFDAPQVAQR